MTFFPGEDVYYEHSGCKITGIKCKYDGTVSISEDYDCDITSTTPSTTTSTQKTSPTTPPTQRPGCHHDGIFYNPGETIYEGKQEDWCFGAVCSDDAKIIEWDNLQCNTTTQAPTTISTTNLPIAGCVVEGEFYLPGELILEYQQKEVCVKTTCELNGVKKDEKIGDC
uniref:uncharacterized protein LOC120342923 n=1 Tax=Styela clava TaxID=7725 RepID=UPI0019395F72|nr:uncharacterized protein LOC120342923 [Styela clava]